MSAIKKLTHVFNNDNFDDKSSDKDKALIILIKKVHKQFKEIYLKHYLFHVFPKVELIFMKITSIPCLFEKYKIDELVFDKRSHFNALYKEVTLLSLPYMAHTRFYNKLEQLFVMRNFMLLPYQFSPNLYPSGKILMGIMENRQNLLFHNANRRFEEFTKFSKKRHIRESKHYHERPLSDNYKEEQFKLADISYSMDNKEKENFFHFYFKKGAYITSEDDITKKKKKTQIKEIEDLINEIARNEENSDGIKVYKRVLSPKTNKTFSQKKSSKKYSGKILMTAFSPKKANYNTTSTDYIPRIKKSSQFKRVDQFITMNNLIEKQEQEKTMLLNDLVNQFQKRIKKSTLNKNNHHHHQSFTKVNVGKIYNFKTITNHKQKIYEREGILNLKTAKLLKKIEDFNLTQRDAIISGYNFEKKKFPKIYSKNIIQSQKNQIKRFFLDHQVFNIKTNNKS